MASLGDYITANNVDSNDVPTTSSPFANLSMDIWSQVFLFMDFDSYTNANAAVGFKFTEEIKENEKNRRVLEAKTHTSRIAQLIAGSEEPTLDALQEALEWRQKAELAVGQYNADNTTVDLVTYLCPSMRRVVDLVRQDVRARIHSVCTRTLFLWLDFSKHGDNVGEMSDFVTLNRSNGTGVSLFDIPNGRLQLLTLPGERPTRDRIGAWLYPSYLPSPPQSNLPSPPQSNLPPTLEATVETLRRLGYIA